MPVEKVPGTALTYHLIAFDADGRERTDDPGGVMSKRVLDAVRETPVTDVFLFTHGWMGDVPAARDQFGRWVGVMARCSADLAKIEAQRPRFLPLLIGLHWPSLPWGDDNFGARAASFAAGAVGAAMIAPEISPVETAAARTCDSPAAREALRTIFAAAERDIAPAELPSDVRAAYEVLDREIGLRADGPEAAPGDDREPFDPDRAYRLAQDGPVSFGGSIGDGLLAPLRTLSFWTMKDRARRLGEGQAHQFLGALRDAAGGGGRAVRFHLMGHSFGCIVVSAMVAGPAGRDATVVVDSLALIQGALSLWSYCEAIPFGSSGLGYFRRLLDGRVLGPILTTRSEFDRANGRWYPWAAGVARQVDFAPPAELPKYGAVGAFGARGPGIDLVDADLLDVDGDYGFEPGRLYNLDGRRYIRKGGGFAGAHSDFDHPQVAHAIWQAAGAR